MADASEDIRFLEYILMEFIRLYKMNIGLLADEKAFAESYAGVSDERRVKVDRIRTEADKRRSLGAGLLMARAMDDLNVADNERQLVYGENGKPYLELHPELQFSISHSGEWVVLAIDDSSMVIGCDIEEFDSVGKIQNIAKRAFTQKELLAFEALDSEDRMLDYFYNIWTAKESYVKATGNGLGTDFRKLEIREADDFIQIRNTDTDDLRYILRMKIADGYSFSICVTKKDVGIEERG